MDLLSAAVVVTVGLVLVVVVGSVYRYWTGGWDGTTALGVGGTTTAAACYLLARLATTPALPRSVEVPLLLAGLGASGVVLVVAGRYAVRARQG